MYILSIHGLIGVDLVVPVLVPILVVGFAFVWVDLVDVVVVLWVDVVLTVVVVDVDLGTDLVVLVDLALLVDEVSVLATC